MGLAWPSWVSLFAGASARIRPCGHGEAQSSTYLSQNEVRTWFDPATLRVISSEWKFSSKGVAKTHARIESVTFKRTNR